MDAALFLGPLYVHLVQQCGGLGDWGILSWVQHNQVLWSSSTGCQSAPKTKLLLVWLIVAPPPADKEDCSLAGSLQASLSTLESTACYAVLFLAPAKGLSEPFTIFCLFFFLTWFTHRYRLVLWHALASIRFMFTGYKWRSQFKNPAYGRQRISRPMRIVGPIQFWRGCVIYLI